MYYKHLDRCHVEATIKRNIAHIACTFRSTISWMFWLCQPIAFKCVVQQVCQTVVRSTDWPTAIGVHLIVMYLRLGACGTTNAHGNAFQCLSNIGALCTGSYFEWQAQAVLSTKGHSPCACKSAFCMLSRMRHVGCSNTCYKLHASLENGLHWWRASYNTAPLSCGRCSSFC